MHLRCRQRHFHLPIEPRGDVGGQLRGTEQAVPATVEHEVCDAGFGHGRHVRQHRPAARAGEGEGTQLARLDVGERERRSDEHHLDLPADEIADGGAGAAIGDVGEVDAGAGFEQLAREMQRVADARRAIGQLVGGIARQRDQLAHRRGTQGGVDRQHIAVGAAKRGDGGEIREHVVRQLAVDARVDRDRCRGDEQCQPVRRRLAHGLGGDGAVGGGPVLDDDRLPELRLQRPREHAGDGIGRSSRERHHDRDRAARILCERRAAPHDASEHEQRRAGTSCLDDDAHSPNRRAVINKP